MIERQEVIVSTDFNEDGSKHTEVFFNRHKAVLELKIDGYYKAQIDIISAVNLIGIKDCIKQIIEELANGELNENN